MRFRKFQNFLFPFLVALIMNDISSGNRNVHDAWVWSLWTKSTWSSNFFSDLKANLHKKHLCVDPISSWNNKCAENSTFFEKAFLQWGQYNFFSHRYCLRFPRTMIGTKKYKKLEEIWHLEFKLCMTYNDRFSCACAADSSFLLNGMNVSN